MPLISSNDLTAYFQQRGNRFSNANGMEFLLIEGSSMHNTTLVVDFYDDLPYEVSIYTTEETADQFIEGFQINNTDEIETLGYNNSWVRYLKGDAEIEINALELEAEFTFRIYKRRTTVSSLDLHFYDEVYKHLTKPEHFMEYLTANERRHQNACMNRYKL